MMKKACLILLALSLVFVAVSCKTTDKSAGPGPTNTPPWLNEFPPEDVLWGIGSAKQADPSKSMDFAEARARNSVARQLSARTQQMITDYYLEAGNVGSQATSSLQEDVSRQIINMDVSGAVPDQRWEAPDGRWWFRVVYKKSDAKAAIASILGNQEAQFAQFKAQQALQMMDAQLAKSENASAWVTDENTK